MYMQAHTHKQIPDALARYTTSGGLYDHISHHAFYPIAPHETADLTLQLYTNFIPADNPDSAWFGHIPTPIHLTERDDDIKISIRKQDVRTRSRDRVYDGFDLNEHRTATRETLDETLDDIYREYRSTNPDNIQYLGLNQTLSRPARRTLTKRFDNPANWLYTFQSHLTPAVLDELKDITNTVATAIKHQGTAATPPDTTPDTCSIITCPTCHTTTWKAPYYPGMPNTISVMQYVAYCPNCHETNIPRTHISDPQPFTPISRTPINDQ